MMEKEIPGFVGYWVDGIIILKLNFKDDEE